MSEIGVAIAGTGFGQKVHLPALQAHHRTRVTAIYHRDLAKAQAIAETHGISHACDTIEAMVALPDVQAVSVTTPPFLHYDMAKTVLSAGKHLLLEKPTTLNVSEASKLLDLSKAHSVVTAMNFEFRYIPAWQRLAELLADGYVGKLRFIKIDWLVSSRADASRPWNWYARQDQGGGILGAIGSHAFDYVAWLFGPIKQICARLSVSVPQRPDPLERGALKQVDAEDTAMILLELTDRTPVNISLASTTYQGRGHWVEVYGDRGTLILGSANQADYVHGFQLWGSHEGKPLTELEIPERLAFPKTYDDGRIAPLVRVIDRWVQGIDQGRSLTPSLQEGVHSQLLMDLARQSDATGQWMSVTV